MKRVAPPVAIALVLLAGFFLWGARVRPAIGGDDFFSLVCFSRDLAAGATDVPAGRYVYFPGGYTVFRAAIALNGASLAALQWDYLMFILANVGLTGAVAGRVTRSFPAGIAAALLSMGLCLRSQGLDGCIGLLAPIPGLAALALVAGKPFSGRAGLARACILGAALGLALSMKQQAGFLALGAAAFLVRKPRAPLLLLPATALASFGLAIAFEGHGLDPLRWGLGAVTAYASQGSFLGNVFGSLHHPRALGGLFLGNLVAAGAWGWLAVRRPDLRAEPWLSVLGFSALAALATFVQFTRRDYAQYALLAIPFLSIALALLAAAARSKLALAALGMAGLVLWATAPIPDRFRNHVQDEVELVRPLLTPRDELVVFPLRRNDVHFLLGTRVRSSPLGYFWPTGLGLTFRDRDWDAVTAVLVSGRDACAPEREAQEAQERQEVLAFVEGKGFRRVATTTTFELLRR